jgi:hypothetical protein
MPFARCEFCSKHLEMILCASTEAEKAIVKRQRESHRELVSVARTRNRFREELGSLHPELCVSLSIDGMDTNKTDSPGEGDAIDVLSYCLCRFIIDMANSYLQGIVPTQKLSKGSPWGRGLLVL